MNEQLLRESLEKSALGHVNMITFQPAPLNTLVYLAADYP